MGRKSRLNGLYVDSDGTELTVEQDGDGKWYFNSKSQLHRLGGPAAEWVDGNKFWYQDGKYHRLDGPAIEYADGDKEWYQNDLLHRLDGPAVEYADGNNWIVNGKSVEPLFLVAYWLERGRCCWFDETTQTLCFSDP